MRDGMCKEDVTGSAPRDNSILIVVSLVDLLTSAERIAGEGALIASDDVNVSSIFRNPRAKALKVDYKIWCPF